MDTLEQSLSVIAARIASPEFAHKARQYVQTGADVKYSVVIKKDGDRLITVLSFRDAVPQRTLLVFRNLS